MISRSRLDSDGSRSAWRLRDSSAGRSRGSTYVPPVGDRASSAPVSSLGVPSLSA